MLGLQSPVFSSLVYRQRSILKIPEGPTCPRSACTPSHPPEQIKIIKPLNYIIPKHKMFYIVKK